MKKLIVNILKDWINKINNNECSDEEINKSMKLIDDHRKIINPQKLCNAKKAMEMLNMKNNRNKFFKLIKKYNIKQQKINNQPIGYNINDINKIKIMENFTTPHDKSNLL